MVFPMQITQLEAVVEIARAGSFRKAAQVLGRSQPSLSRLVLQIEEEIGLTVFDRAPTGVRLTKAGQRLHRRAVTVLEEVQRLKDEAGQLQNLQRGTLRIAISPAVGSAFLPKALPSFRRRWPGVQLEVLNVLYPESLRMLREGQVEIVIGPIPEALSDNALHIAPLSQLRVVVVTHRHNARRDVTSLQELADANWLVHGPADGPSSLFGPPLPALAGQSVTRCHSLTTLLTVMAESDGFSFLSDKLLEQLGARYDLREVPVREPLPTFTLAIMTRRQTAVTPAAETLIRQLKAQAQKPPV